MLCDERWLVNEKHQKWGKPHRERAKCRGEGERSEKVIQSWRRKDPELSSLRPLPSPLCSLFSLSPVPSLCDWTLLPVWPGFWSQHITSHLVSHNRQSLELAARLCVHPVHKPAAEGTSKHAHRKKNNSTIWFICDKVIVNWCAHPSLWHKPPWFNAGQAEVRSFTEGLSSATQSIIRLSSALLHWQPCSYYSLEESICLGKQS